MQSVISILFAVIMFGVLIFVHELGHFFAARACGVQVNEFSLGMGPTLLKKQGKETLYSLRLLPIGGFCAMEGEDEDCQNARAFGRQKGWKRLIILAAGALMNFLTGVLILVCLYASSTAFATTDIVDIQPGCSAENVLQPGDRILSINGRYLFVYNDFSMILSRIGEDTVDVTVRRDGEKVTLTDVPLYAQEFENEDGSASVRYGISFGITEATPANRLGYALRESADFVRMVWYGIEDLIRGAAGIRDLSGPIGIVSTMNQVSEQSNSRVDAMLNLLYFAAFIAINLGVMNLLPLPALDGGRIFFLLLNGLLSVTVKRQIPAKYEGYVHAAGMLLLLALMVVVAMGDVLRLVR